MRHIVQHFGFDNYLGDRLYNNFWSYLWNNFGESLGDDLWNCWNNWLSNNLLNRLLNSLNSFLNIFLQFFFNSVVNMNILLLLLLLLLLLSLIVLIANFRLIRSNNTIDRFFRLKNLRRNTFHRLPNNYLFLFLLILLRCLLGSLLILALGCLGLLGRLGLLLGLWLLLGFGVLWVRLGFSHGFRGFLCGLHLFDRLDNWCLLNFILWFLLWGLIYSLFSLGLIFWNTFSNDFCFFVFFRLNGLGVFFFYLILIGFLSWGLLSRSLNVLSITLRLLRLFIWFNNGFSSLFLRLRFLLVGLLFCLFVSSFSTHNCILIMCVICCFYDLYEKSGLFWQTFCKI